ncbi:hypothetical protein DUNSADRAFT_11462 [Dunaliella salina]|uniref:Uncharacterized protein n=1 Tax=Dunaliella salina TaxID=3046 RepID=A0ABQ7GDB7_DUNSA|nr:hypothetical protein DUNSADRAFT_11462 [Dunaliella salina]|eukprot:KAF5832590.1 hypothetical protein DUNSADRAFT_11462 [Dunaliella salina]
MMLQHGKGFKGISGASHGRSKLTSKTLPSSRMRLPPTVNAASRPQRLYCAAANHGDAPALLLELDGAVVDLHSDGHRVAFNKAFESLGFECVNWPVHVYNDLLGRGDGTPEGFIAAYFEMMGWPEMMATSDRARFLTKVHEAKQEEMFKMLRSGQVPLRDRVHEVLEQAAADGAPLAFISGTQSEMADAVVFNTLNQLPASVSESVRVFQSGVVPQEEELRSCRGTQEEDSSTGSQQGSWEGQLRSAQRGEKQKQALNFAAAFSASSSTGSSGIGIDPNLLAAPLRQSVTPEWLQAVSSMLGVPSSRCILLGSTSSIMEAASAARMTAVVVPRRLAHQGTYEHARAKFTGFGAGDCTWSRLKSLIPKQ